MMKVKLGTLGEIFIGLTYKPEDVSDEGTIVLRSSNIQNGKLDFEDIVRVQSNIKDKLMVKDGDILMCSRNGSARLVGKTAMIKNLSEPMTFGAFMTIIRTNKNPYLQYYFKSDYFRRQLKGSTTTTINQITRNMLLNIEVPLLTESEEIVNRLERIENIINMRKQELQALDNLIKSRFVEMFGDSVSNSKKLPVKSMPEVCEIIDGDRGKNYPNQEEFSDEGYCLFLNAKNVTSKGFSFENCMFVTKEKDEILRKGHLKRGDVVLTTRGTIGNLAFYDESVPFENVRINSGMVILRMNHEILLEHFFIEQFKMQLASIREKITSGSAQPQLPISTMNKIVVLMPTVEQQQVFADFVKQVNKSKLLVQKSLDETQQLFDALMQKYFS